MSYFTKKYINIKLTAENRVLRCRDLLINMMVLNQMVIPTEMQLMVAKIMIYNLKSIFFRYNFKIGFDYHFHSIYLGFIYNFVKKLEAGLELI
jgi:hypothetical protein